MTHKEIMEKLNNGDIVTVEHYIKKVYKRIGGVNITNSQYEKIYPLLKLFKSDFGGITRHYYKLKE